jgi:hypothetical protein
LELLNSFEESKIFLLFSIVHLQYLVMYTIIHLGALFN